MEQNVGSPEDKCSGKISQNVYSLRVKNCGRNFPPAKTKGLTTENAFCTLTKTYSIIIGINLTFSTQLPL